MLQKETACSLITFDANLGFLKVVSKSVDEITLADARHDFQVAAEMVNFERMPVLADSRNYTQFSKDIRDFYASSEAAERITGMAILVNSISTRLIGNFFINFHKPHFPTKLFSQEQEAIEWLVKLVKEAKKENSTLEKTIG